MNDKPVTMVDLKQVYLEHIDVFNQHAEKLQSNKMWSTVSSLFSEDWSKYENSHVSW